MKNIVGSGVSWYGAQLYTKLLDFYSKLLLVILHMVFNKKEVDTCIDMSVSR